MALALRKIRRTKWHPEDEFDLGWVPDRDIVADLLIDLPTKAGILSVWHIEDNHSNLDRVLAAFTTTSDGLDSVDYALFDQALLSPLGVEVVHTPGETADPTVNKKWHRDLRRLSGHRLVELARVIKECAMHRRVPRKCVMALAAKGVVSGQIRWQRLTEKMQEQLAEKVKAVRSATTDGV